MDRRSGPRGISVLPQSMSRHARRCHVGVTRWLARAFKGIGVKRHLGRGPLVRVVEPASAREGGFADRSRVAPTSSPRPSRRNFEGPSRDGGELHRCLLPRWSARRRVAREADRASRTTSPRGSRTSVLHVLSSREPTPLRRGDLRRSGAGERRGEPARRSLVAHNWDPGKSH